MWWALVWQSKGAGSSLRNVESSMLSTGPRNLETVVLGTACIQLFLRSCFKSLLLGIRQAYSTAVFSAFHESTIKTLSVLEVSLCV